MCKPTFYNFYTSHLRWNSTIYHTDLGKNAVFHKFSRQIALSQYSGRSIVGFKRNRSKHFQNHPYGQLVLISIGRAVSVVECLNELFKIELRFNIITKLLLLFFCFLMVSVITMCNLIKCLIRATFLSTPASDVHERWKQKGTDKRLKLQERLLTINERNIIRWNIYRDTNFHSRRQVLKYL